MRIESINIVRLVPTITFAVVPGITVEIFAFRTDVIITSASVGIGGITWGVPETLITHSGNFVAIPLAVFMKIASSVWAIW
jgi:hypothetical protein